MTDKEESVKKRRVRCDSAETEMSDGFRDQDLVDTDLETADFFFPRPIEHEIQEEAEIGELFDIPKEEIDDSKDSISTSEKEKDNDDSDWITDNEEDEEAVNDKEEQDGFMMYRIY
ncbi:hypothetical protein CU097_010866 [Rhizopus azygosporus]|uniref:Uncharacterized protein n=1 Tax=Rhizopus azygosporus TaxID=86630 RepID=A0A367JBW5_RHIAZ|nr:hypothetical protein CU097_010866 [Rhizopus azygosporus]